MSKKILLTGVKGFLGRFVVNEIKIQTHPVRRGEPPSSPGAISSTLDKEGRALVDTSDIDLTKLEKVEKLNELDFGEIVHIAGVTNKNKNKFKEGYEANVIMMENLIRLAKIKKIKRIIFISSNSVNYRTDDYAESKKLAEKLLVESGLDYVILRPTLIVGSASAETIKLKKWLNILPVIPLPNSGKTYFSPINPTDLARLIVKVVESENMGIYTVGGERITFRGYFEKIAEKKLKIANINSGMFLMVGKLFGLTTAEGMVKEIKTDNEELKKIYNWKPKPSICLTPESPFKREI